jgi:MFS family permease
MEKPLKPARSGRGMRETWLVPLCLASLFWSFSFGLSAPLASLEMQTAGCSDTAIGLNTATYYLGIAAAAAIVPWLMRRWGFGCPVAGMIASGVTAAALPWSGGIAGWFVIRGFNGVAGALSLIPLETDLNHRSAPGRRSLNFGYYAFCIALGMALGNLAGLQMHQHAPRTAFMVGGAAAVVAGLIVLMWRPAPIVRTHSSQQQGSIDFTRNSLSFGSAWSQGFLEGGMVSLLPIYLLATGLSQDQVSWLMSGIMVGVIVAQVPIAWLADRLGRTAILTACNLAALAGIAVLLVHDDPTSLTFWLFVVGACSGAFYPLGLAVLGERVPASNLARANAWYLGINCMGSLTGPVVTGLVMDCFGRGAMFLAGAGAILLVLVVWLASGTRKQTMASDLDNRLIEQDLFCEEASRTVAV